MANLSLGEASPSSSLAPAYLHSGDDLDAPLDRAMRLPPSTDRGSLTDDEAEVGYTHPTMTIGLAT